MYFVEETMCGHTQNCYIFNQISCVFQAYLFFIFSSKYICFLIVCYFTGNVLFLNVDMPIIMLNYS